MANQENDYGKKGYCLLYAFVALLLFVILVVSIYYRNMDSLPQ